MDKYYSSFWLDYSAGKIILHPEFKDRDTSYYEESDDFCNVRGRIVTTATQTFVINGHAVCDIEGKQL